MANKDFLSSLSEDKKPASFKEEERVKVEKEQSPALKYAVIAAVAIAVISLLVYVWVVLLPHIKFNDFTNKKVEEVQAFLAQNKIDSSGIVFLEEYNFDVEKGYIISQSVSGDKKIHKNEKITFYVSKGADPNESVSVPDLESMNRKQIESWINDNKLQGVKISTAYSNEVEKDGIISIVFKNDDRQSFTRSSQVTITFSKGEQPASTLKVIDLKEKSYAEAEAFAKEKKLNIKKIETTSTTIEKGLIISTSPAFNENIKEGETLTVYVSKGIAVVVPDLVGKTVDDLNIFKLGDGKSVVFYEKYIETTDKSLANKIKEQNIKAGTKITDEVFVLTIYKYVEAEKLVEVKTYTVPELEGKTIDELNVYKLGDGKNITIYEKEEITTDINLKDVIKLQSIKAGTKITAEEVLIITIYKYEEQVIAPVLNNIDDLNIFKLGDGKNITIYEKYEETNDESLDGKVKNQNVEAGNVIEDKVFVVTIYKYVSPTTPSNND